MFYVTYLGIYLCYIIKLTYLLMVLYSSRFLAQKQFLKAHKLLMYGRLDMCSRGYSFTVKRMRSFIIHYSSETIKATTAEK